MRKEYEITSLTFSFKGVAKRELRAAEEIAGSAKVRSSRIVSLPDLKEAGELVGNRFEGLPKTFVPMRNGIFYSYAASIAEEEGADVIVGGHNADDRKVYPDARREFFDALGKAFRLGAQSAEGKRLRVVLPLEAMTKPEVVGYARAQGVPLGLTWSCHEEGPEHCWECEGCIARIRAFESAGIADPLRLTGKIT